MWPNAFSGVHVVGGVVMLYEKKKNRPKEFVPLVCLEVVLLVFIVWELIYYYTDTSSAFWDMKFVDVANIVAQIATAGAFALGFYQYQRGKKIERQNVLVVECKSVILKMIEVIKKFDVGADTNIKNIKSCCVALGGLGTDFNEFFVELDETVNKGIVRMHWQNMFFNELLSVMAQLELSEAVGKTNIPRENYLYALTMAKEKVKEELVVESLKRYTTFLYVLQADMMKSVKAEFSFSDVYLFVLYFFEGEFTEEYMYGALSKLDVRTRAPLIAAIKEVCDLRS